MPERQLRGGAIRLIAVGLAQADLAYRPFLSPN